MSEAPATSADGSAVRWLSEPERDAWLALATVVLRLPGALDSQLQRDSGIGFYDYLVLSSISMVPGRAVRMSELAQLANGSLSRLSNVVKRLEHRGWVHRGPDPEDGRYTVATLTDAGFEVVRAAAPGHVEAVRHLVIDPLTTAQLRAVVGVGERIRSRLGEPRPGPGDCDGAGAAPC